MSPYKDPEKKREHDRKYYQLNKEKKKAQALEGYHRRRQDPVRRQHDLDRNRAYYKENRAFLIDYLGGKCTACGTTENLELDHKNPDEKLFNPCKRLTVRNLSDEIMKEVDKCHLLCRDCHNKKTWTLDKDTIMEKIRASKEKNNEL
tara:strand:- start:972 stop:1412 length:441 start_codon:yes stop_codon:yes gene_type:complete